MPNPNDFDYPMSRSFREWTDPSLPHLVSPEEEVRERDWKRVSELYEGMVERVARRNPAPRRGYDRGNPQIKIIFVPMPSLPPKVEGKKTPTLKTPKE